MSGLVFPCILGAIIGLIVLNYRHSLRCENAIEHDETEDFVNALERRLATAELMGASNDKLMERLKYLLTERLTSVDAGKLDAIYANAEAIAVKDALKLQSVVGLPFPNVLSSNTGIGGESERDALLDNAYSTASFAASGGGGGSGLANWRSASSCGGGGATMVGCGTMSGGGALATKTGASTSIGSPFCDSCSSCGASSSGSAAAWP